MRGTPVKRGRRLRLPGIIGLVAVLATTVGASQAGSAPAKNEPKFSEPKAFDVSKPLRELAKSDEGAAKPSEEVRPDKGVTAPGKAHKADGALQSSVATQAISAPLANFEGLSNQDNFNVLGGRVNPPDPVGDVGPNHYVEMVNLVFGVYDKSGTKLLGPVRTGALWQGFPVTECALNAGDPIVLYDQFSDRWILSQFTSKGINFPNEPLNLFYNCVAISTSGDPTGSYYRYAFTTGYNFPDYPKYGVWRDSYVITTREFGIQDPNIYGIGVYGLERNKMIEGDPNARAVSFLLRGTNADGSDNATLPLVGDGLLPPDVDGKTKPKSEVPAPIVGTQDDGGPYGATFDALNVWELDVKWHSTPTASLELATQLPVAEFDSNYPCNGPAFVARDCLPQPGITETTQYIDILSYRQRPTWRLAYRNTGAYETLVTNQSVEASPLHAGSRWYEIRRTNGAYSVFQQGTYAPEDGVHRWMGSAAMDKMGNIGLGYSVVNGTDVYPGIRYTGRLAGDPLGQMTLGEGVVVNGSGVQTTANSRWGDYTSLNVDPVDDCTLWYVNEYYTAAGQASSPAGWQTRIASFKLPGCS
jgi:hypothetical protein